MTHIIPAQRMVTGVLPAEPFERGSCELGSIGCRNESQVLPAGRVARVPATEKATPVPRVLSTTAVLEVALDAEAGPIRAILV